MEDEDGVDGVQEYRLVMRPGADREREYVVARFAEASAPDLAGAVAAKMYRRGEETRELREEALRVAEREERKARSLFGQRKTAQLEARMGKALLPERLKKKWVLEVDGVPADDDAAHEDVMGAGSRYEYTGSFEGEQKAAYAYFVMKDDNTVEVIPLPPRSWFSFRGKKLSGPTANGKAHEKTDVDASKRFEAQAKARTKLIAKLEEDLGNAMAGSVDVFGRHGMANVNKWKKSQAKAPAEVDEGLDFVEKFDDNDVEAELDKEESDEEEVEEKPKKKRGRKKVKSEPGAAENNPSPRYPATPGSPGSGSESEDLDDTGKEIQRLLKMEEKRQHGGPSPVRSPPQSPPQSPGDSSSEGRKRSPPNIALGPAAGSVKRPRTNEAGNGWLQEIPNELLPRPGQFVNAEHVRAALNYAADAGLKLAMSTLYDFFKQVPGQSKAELKAILRDKTLLYAKKDEEGKAYLNARPR